MEVFKGLLTVTDQDAEIRMIDLVATKAHSQFELGLSRMRDSLDLYGLGQPRLFYTDNMSDKPFLESAFPSLQEGIVPINTHRGLPIFKIPDGIQVVERKTVAQIRDAIGAIVTSLGEDRNVKVAVGLDTEWNVSLRKGETAGRTAILQIAYGTVINICHVSTLRAPALE